MMTWDDGRGERSIDARHLSEANELDHGASGHLLDPGVSEPAAEAHAERRSHLLHVRLWRRITRRG